MNKLLILKSVIKKNPKVTEKELASLLNCSERTVRRYVKILRDRKELVLVKYGNNRYWNIK